MRNGARGRVVTLTTMGEIVTAAITVLVAVSAVVVS